MAHFASGLWPNDFGPVPYNNGSTSVCVTPVVSSGTSNISTITGTEGTNKATFYVPSSGVYRVNMTYRPTDATINGATSVTLGILATYTPVSGTTATNSVLIPSGQMPSIATRTAGHCLGLSSTIRVYKSPTADSTVVVGPNLTFSGTATAGNYELTFSLEKISD